MVLQIADLLTSSGAHVIPFYRHSDDIPQMSITKKMLLPTQPIYSFDSVRRFRSIIHEQRPDVLQIHNLFPLISPAVLRVAKVEGIPIVNFVHNYRHVCLAATLFRDHHDCRLCLDRRSKSAAVRFKCYRNSYAQSALMALSYAINDPTWSRVDRFVAVSQFVKERLIESGLDEDKIFVRLNTVPDPGPTEPATGSSFLFAARLDYEKGVTIVIDAWERAQLPRPWSLRVAGSGPLADVVRDAATHNPTITYLGQLDRTALYKEYRNSVAVLVPSTWPEPCPLSAVEALAHGRPVVASNVGGLPELVDDSVGWLTSPAATGFAAAFHDVIEDIPAARLRAENARLRYLERHSPEGSIPRLLALHDFRSNS